VAGKSAEKANDLAELNQPHLGQAKDKLIKYIRKALWAEGLISCLREHMQACEIN
jgi:hypothetical protein